MEFILIYDRDGSRRQAMSKINLGAHTVMVDNSDSAMSMFFAAHPDMVIVDWQTALDSFFVNSLWLRFEQGAFHVFPTVIIVDDVDGPENETEKWQEAKSMRADGFVPRPIDSERFSLMIRAMLLRPKLFAEMPDEAELEIARQLLAKHDSIVEEKVAGHILPVRWPKAV